MQRHQKTRTWTDRTFTEQRQSRLIIASCAPNGRARRQLGIQLKSARDLRDGLDLNALGKAMETGEEAWQAHTLPSRDRDRERASASSPHCKEYSNACLPQSRITEGAAEELSGGKPACGGRQASDAHAHPKDDAATIVSRAWYKHMTIEVEGLRLQRHASSAHKGVPTM